MLKLTDASKDLIVAGIGMMMALALDANGAKKVYIMGRRLEKLQEAAAQAVCTKASRLAYLS